MPCDARSFCDLFKRKGPTQRLKTAKKSFLRPLWTPYPQTHRGKTSSSLPAQVHNFDVVKHQDRVGDTGHVLEQRGDKGRGGRHESSVTDHLLLVAAENGQVKVGDVPVQLASRPVLVWTHKLGLDSHFSGLIKSSAGFQLNCKICKNFHFSQIIVYLILFR